MAEYKIVRVSQEAPKEHFNEKYNSTTYYIKVMLEGHTRPVSIGKRSANALKAGDTVHGTITTTEFDTDNFKADALNPPVVPGGSFEPKDQNTIRAQWAIGQAKDLYLGVANQLDKGTEFENWILERSQWFYRIVEEVKANSPATDAESVKQFFSDGSPVDTVHPFDDKPISLDEIPF